MTHHSCPRIVRCLAAVLLGGLVLGCQDPEHASLPSLAELATVCPPTTAATTFCMGAGARYVGSDPMNWAAEADEYPRVLDDLPYALLIQRHTVSVETWSLMMPELTRIDRDQAPDVPVAEVSWWQAAEFANQLSFASGLPPCYQLSGCDRSFRSCTAAAVSGPPCTGWRLPTEREWEHFARYTRDESEQVRQTHPIAEQCTTAPWLDNVRYCASPATGEPGPASPPPDAVVSHVLGNVWEWTESVYAEQRGPQWRGTSGVGLRATDFPARRGCSFSSRPHECRIANRDFLPAGTRAPDTGFRLVRTFPHDSSSEAVVLEEVDRVEGVTDAGADTTDLLDTSPHGSIDIDDADSRSEEH